MTTSNDKNRQMMKYVGLGTQWMVMLSIAVWGGYKLDGMTAWKVPVFTIILPLIALGISLWQLIKDLNKPQK